MEKFILIKPSIEYAQQIAEYRAEFLAAGDSLDGTGPLKGTEDPIAYIKMCEEMETPDTVPEGLVPATQFIFVRTCDNKIVGMIQVRHCFNKYLENFGGHIGYSIRPGERRKGYAKEMLHKVLPFCKEIGLGKVLVTCKEDNIGSEKTIISNGGVFESMVHEPNNHVNFKRFWI